MLNKQVIDQGLKKVKILDAFKTLRMYRGKGDTQNPPPQKKKPKHLKLVNSAGKAVSVMDK